MRLSYRGVQYENASSEVTAIAGEVIGKYRGIELRQFSHRAALISSEPLTGFQYRGTYYTKHIGIH